MVLQSFKSCLHVIVSPSLILWRVAALNEANVVSYVLVTLQSHRHKKSLMLYTRMRPRSLLKIRINCSTIVGTVAADETQNGEIIYKLVLMHN